MGIKDEGMYVCVAQNQFGTNEASGYLTITGICKMFTCTLLLVSYEPRHDKT